MKLKGVYSHLAVYLFFETAGNYIAGLLFFLTECTNRQLKNNLNLRPVYHQKDERSDAHLFFGLSAYWVVNTIRCQLKREGESCYWTEIVRRMSTQKIVTTKGKNPLGETIEMRQCSSPSKQAKQIYNKLNLKHSPFKKNKICRTQSP